MIEKEQKFILFASNKQSDHLKLYIDAELKAIDGTWCFFCHNKLNKKNGKNFQNWGWVKNNEDFEKVKLVVIISEPFLKLNEAKASKFAEEPELTIKPYFFPKIFETFFSNIFTFFPSVNDKLLFFRTSITALISL